jgi:hypothetical protein
MKQGTLFDMTTTAAAGPAWMRQGGNFGKIDTWYLHQATGCSIHHCGHPTANFPYYILTAAGERILAENGRGFMRLDLAKRYVEETAESASS